MVLRLIGTATTDNNGVAVLSNGYTGTGAGMVDFVASAEIDGGSVVSGTFIVEDTIAYDLCIDNSHSSQWSHSDSNEVTVDDTGMLINHNTTGLSTNTFKTPSASSDFCYTSPIMVEFNVVEYTGNTRIQFYDNTNLIQVKLSQINAVADSHVKLALDNNKRVCFAYVDGVLKQIINTDTGSPLSDFTFRFRLEDNSAFKFKNLKINNTDSTESILFYENGTINSLNGSWTADIGLTPSLTSTGILLENSTSSGKGYWANIGGGSKNDYNPPFAVEFDVVSTTGCRVILSSNSSSGSIDKTMTSLLSGNNHVKFVVRSDTYDCIVDGEYKNNNTSHSMVSPIGVALITQSNCNLRFKNFKIYPI